MKKKLLLVLGATMIMGALTACGSKTDEQVDTTVEETTEVEGVGDVIPESDFTIFDNTVFTFQYETAYFALNEDSETVTVNFNNDDIQTAGANTVIFTTIKGADAMQVIKDHMKDYDASEDEMVENYLAGDDIKGYSYATGELGSDSSELKTSDAFYAVPCGDDVILIDVMRTHGSDTAVEDTIDEKIADILTSFKLD